MEQVTQLALGETRSAILSSETPDPLYRYQLLRRFKPGPLLLWIMLNPSKADAFSDDPTVRLCCAWGRMLGFFGVVIVNLYAWRSTDPQALLTASDPVGPENDRHIAAALADHEAVMCAWGAHGDLKRVAEVKAMIRAAGRGSRCLGITKSGAPRHPLRVPYSTVPFDFPV